MSRSPDKLRALLSEPPIRDRVLWQGLLHPDARDRDDRAVMATAFGVLYSAGGAIGLLILAVNDATIVDAGPLLAASATAILVGLICLLGYRRLPRRFFHLAATLGIATVTVAGLSAEPGAEPVFAPFFAFVVMLCLLLFRLRPAIAQGVLAMAAYAALLYANETPFATHLLLSLAGMLIALGVLISVQRTRTVRIAGELSIDAYIDSLTGIPNRRSFDQRLELELERARRVGDPIALVICDLDHFKQVNDTHGHEAGDVVLRRAAAVLQRTTRTIDLAARIGGEEFGLILPGAGPDEAIRVAERVRLGIKEEFGIDGPALTASCGAASQPAEEADRRPLFAAADHAMYAAKRAGRDCTALAEGEQARIIGGGTTLGRLRQIL